MTGSTCPTDVLRQFSTSTPTLVGAPSSTGASISPSAAAEAKLLRAREAEEAARTAAAAAAAATAEAEQKRQQLALAEAEARERERRLRDERERQARHEASLRDMLQQRNEAARIKRAEEEEREADRLAQVELAVVAEMVRQQAAQDAIAAQQCAESMRLAELPHLADRWQRRSVLRRMFTKWVRKVTDIAEMMEHEEALMMRREQFKDSVKNLIVGGNVSRSRTGGYRVTPRAPPISDEVRTKALDEVSVVANHITVLIGRLQESARHASLWAKGSFTSALHRHLGSIPLWEVWLSPGSNEGSSSIWLKTKFDVTADTSTVSRIPLFNDISKEYFNSPSSPGIIIFELSADPFADKKRLEDHVVQFPPNRHFVPSILFFKFSGPAPTLNEPLRSTVWSS